MKKKICALFILALSNTPNTYAMEGEGIQTIVCPLFTQPDVRCAWKELFATTVQLTGGSKPKALAQWGQETVKTIVTGKSMQVQERLQDRLFDVLYDMQEGNKDEKIYYQGNRLPAVLCAFLKNQEPAQGTLQAAHRFLDGIDGRDKIVLKALTSLIFSPEKLARTLKPQPEVTQLLRECRAAHPEVQLVLSTNNNSRTVEALRGQEHFAEFFALFNRTMCSGEVGHLYPGKEYLALEGFNPHSTLRLEDEGRHARVAERAGFRTLVLEGPDDVAAARKELVAMKLLRE